MHHLPVFHRASPLWQILSTKEWLCARTSAFLLRTQHSEAWLLSMRMCRGQHASESYHTPRGVCMAIWGLENVLAVSGQFVLVLL